MRDKCATLDLIIGQKITGVRKLSKKELEDNDWEYFSQDSDFCVLIQLENGMELWALRDAEGNGPGIMIANNLKTGEQNYLWR